MRVTTKAEIDVFMLFVHDRWDTQTLRPTDVARAIERVIHDRTGEEHWRIVSPDDSGLDRFTLNVEDGSRKDGRLHSVEEVKHAFPTQIVKVLRALDGGSFELWADTGTLEATGARKRKT